MIKRIMLTLLLVALVCGAADELNRTEGHYNGRWWLSMSRTAHTGYVVGYSEGFEMGVYTGGTNSPTSPFRAAKLDSAAIDVWDKEMNKLVSANMQGQMTFGEVEDSIDKFYAQPENRVIPIHVLFDYVSQRVHGTPEDVIQQEVLNRRTAYNKAR